MAIPGGLEGLRQEMCSKYQGETDTIYKQLRSIHTRIRGPINKLRQILEQLKLAVTTPIDELTNAIDEMGDQFDDIVPDFSDITELDKLIAACTPFGRLFDGQGNLQDAIDAVSDATLGLASDLINDATDTIMKNIEEYISAKAIDALDKMFKEFRIPKVIIEIDELINCISNMCPGDNTQSIIDKINNIQKEMYFTDTGTFDSARLMVEVGLSADKSYNVNLAKSSLDTFENNAISEASDRVTNVFESVEAIKKAPYIGKISSYF